VLGIADVFTEHGDPAKLLAEMGLDASGLEASVRQRFGDLCDQTAASSGATLKRVV